MAGAERGRGLRDTVAAYISRHSLLEAGQRVVVALSGGGDSVCLLLVLHDLGYRVEAAHCNFHLRGEESMRDQHFVEDLCRGMGVTLHIEHCATQEEAARTGHSVEMAARELRYRWFATLGATVAIAHHSDDNAETVLLNLVRGTGLRGLCGIQPRASVMGAHVVRPLLCVTREEILGYLSRRSQEHVVDSTNLEAIARRNVVRLQVMPLLATLNPSITATLNNEAVLMAEAQALVDESLCRYARQAVDEEGRIVVAAIDACPAPLSLLHHLLAPHGFTPAVTGKVYAHRHGHSGAVYASATHRLLRHDGRFILRELCCQPQEEIVIQPVEGTVALAGGGCLEISIMGAPVEIVRDQSTAMLDIDRLDMPLTLRPVMTGDRFAPFGMKGSKLVSDYMTGLHLNLFEKEQQLVLLGGKEIVWVVGRRISRHAAVTAGTRRVMLIKAIKKG